MRARLHVYMRACVCMHARACVCACVCILCSLGFYFFVKTEPQSLPAEPDENTHLLAVSLSKLQPSVLVKLGLGLLSQCFDQFLRFCAAVRICGAKKVSN